MLSPLPVILVFATILSVDGARFSGYNYGPPQQSVYRPPSRPSVRKPVYRPPHETPIYRPPSKPSPPRPPSKPSPPRPPSKPSPSYRPQNVYETPSSHVQTRQYPRMPYDFEYAIEDRYSGNSYSHTETSDGRTTQGRYQVLLPDGRLQVVTFYDNGDGYHAEVTYH